MAAYLPTLRGLAKVSFALSASLLVLAAGALYFGQTYLIYPAHVPPGSRQIVSTPADYDIPYEELELTAADGVKIKAYLLLQSRTPSGAEVTLIDKEPVNSLPVDENPSLHFAATRPTVLYFHANAGNLGHRIPLARMFYNNIRCNVLMLSYRGYGRSEGHPSEWGIQQDAHAALNYVLRHEILSGTKLILYGQSLGGAVAIHLAAKNPKSVAALILENTFTSIPAVARNLIPFLRPFLWLCTEQWNNLQAIERISPSTHMLLLSGLRDELVPPDHMRQLWSAVIRTNEKRVWQEFPDGTHNDTCVQPEYWLRVKEFVEGL